MTRKKEFNRKVPLVLDYERDQKFDWKKLKEQNFISYIGSKAEELEINIRDFSHYYSSGALLILTTRLSSFNSQLKREEKKK